MAKIRDWAVDQDLQALTVMRRTCVIDYIKWTDNTASRAHVHPRIIRQGIQATMQDLRAADFLSLPTAVLDRPIAALEVSIDFYPRRAARRSETPALLADCFGALVRRLAPWRHRSISSRVYTGAEAGTGRTVYRDPTERLAPSGQPWLIDLERRFDAYVRRPALVGNQFKSDTVYYGHKVDASWPHLPYESKPRAQVRLYCKTTDNGRDLALPEWRVRVEVTLNGALLLQQGLQQVGDIDQAALSAVVSQFILLGQMTGERRRGAHTRRGAGIGPWMARELHRRDQSAQAMALTRTPKEGILSTLPYDHLLRFKTVPELMNMVRVPVADFFKQQRRDRLRLAPKNAGHLRVPATPS